MLTLWNAVPAMDQIFDDVMASAFTGFRSAAAYTPAVDVRWQENEVVVCLDVPGVKRENIELTVENRVLTIKGSRKLETAKGEEVRVGRPYGTFSVAYTLGETMDGDRLSAELADGVLTVRIPKHAKAQPRRIEIQGQDAKKELA